MQVHSNNGIPTTSTIQFWKWLNSLAPINPECREIREQLRDRNLSPLDMAPCYLTGWATGIPLSEQ